jgi:hypothetical protein
MLVGLVDTEHPTRRPGEVADEQVLAETRVTWLELNAVVDMLVLNRVNEALLADVTQLSPVVKELVSKLVQEELRTDHRRFHCLGRRRASGARTSAAHASDRTHARRARSYARAMRARTRELRAHQEALARAGRGPRGACVRFGL